LLRLKPRRRRLNPLQRLLPMLRLLLLQRPPQQQQPWQSKLNKARFRRRKLLAKLPLQLRWRQPKRLRCRTKLPPAQNALANNNSNGRRYIRRRLR
jgi:hypothetical protein